MAQTFDLVGDYAIVQGSTWDPSFYFEGDIRDCTLKGQIRKTFADRTTEVLAEMAFGAIIYAPIMLPGELAAINRSRIAPLLTAEQTRRLPATRPEKLYRYDIEATRPDGRVFKIPARGGAAEVWPEVTRYE